MRIRVSTAIPIAHVRARLMRIAPFCCAVFGFFLFAQLMTRVALYFGADDKSPLGVGLERAVAEPGTDVLFVGTSRLRWGFDPDVFDAETAKLGISTHAYVLGIPALSFVETEYLLREFFRQRPCCVKWVVLEPDMMSEGSLREPHTMRAIRLFDVGTALDYLGYLRIQKVLQGPPMDAATYGRYIGIAMFRHYTNAGIFQLFVEDTHSDFRALQTHRGYTAPGDIKPGDPNTLAGQIAASSDVRQQWHARLEALSRTESSLSAEQYDRYLQLLQFIAQKGARPIVLRPPQTLDGAQAGELVGKLRGDCGNNVPIFDFGSPQEQAVLYDPDIRLDYDHLTLRGVKIFTSLVAKRFAAIAASGHLPLGVCRVVDAR